MNQAEIKVRAGAGVLNQTALDIRGNTERINAAIAAARDQGCQLLCLPELCLTGYGCEDMFLSPGFVDSALARVSDIAAVTAGMVVTVGLPVPFENQVFNGVALLVDGQLVGIVAKQNLAREGLHYEPRWFRPWPAGKTASLVVDGKEVPLGDLVFSIGGLRIGLEICEDAWVQHRPLGRLIQRGVNLVLNPSASHFAFGKKKIREQLILDAVSHPGLSYVYANLLGNEAGRAIYDGDAYLASRGTIVESGSRFSYRESQVTAGDLVFGNDAPGNDAPGTQTTADASQVNCPGWTWNRVETERDSPPTPQTWETSADLKEEEFSRAVALGLFDYVRKSRSNGVVVSLSGGADSAAVTCLGRLMLEFAQNELGIETLWQRLTGGTGPHSLGDSLADSLQELQKRMICTAYQATANSSQTTRDAARAVANGCGTDHFELEIEEIVASYKAIISSSLGRDFSWDQDDIALQNIQARSRSPGIWMFANLRNALLLSTSNRSEAAVGYATMDGDTSGGLAPIAGIDKAFLRQWLNWLEKKGPHGVGPFAFLAAVNVQEPTAELRPLSRGQTDEEDLMPYPVLDFIERSAVRDKLMPGQIVDGLLATFDKVSREQAIGWIRRFFTLWCRNQWKRERYAPSFHLDDESLDPKTWCRFPILSGGFEEELAELV